MEPNRIFEIFFSWENPVIYAVPFVIILIAMILLIRFEFIIPLRRSKRKLELENAKLSALYSEVDPDPIIRIEKDWSVVDMNKAAKEIFNDFDDSKLKSVLTKLKSAYSNKKNKFIEEINKNHYSIIIKDVPELEYKHLYFRDITDRIEYENQILSYQEHVKQLRVRIDNLNEKKNQEIGKELHDGIGHSLSLLKIEVQDFFSKNSINLEDTQSFKLLKSIDELTEEVRDLSHELRPRVLDEFGLVNAVKSLVEIRNQTKNNFGEVRQNKEFRIVDKLLELNIFRVCQEAIKNIGLHSRCKNYFIDFYKKDRLLEITISDDGIGFDVEHEFLKQSVALGLFNMKERIETAGGNFNIISEPNEGTTILISIEVNEDI